MSHGEFKLSRTLYGHSLDVRAIFVTANNDIISGSRDRTAKYWKYNSFQNNYEEIMTYKDQQNFVASVLYLEPSEEFPDGLVVTGGNDCVILIYKPSEPFASYKINDHSKTVSCLAQSNEPNTFFSGSWDTTAKYFQISQSANCVVTFSGHEAAIWSIIQLKDDRVITASADKTISVWNVVGAKLQTLTGHTDCVRALVDFPDLNIFLSAANDASIKLWNYDGENLETLYGHTSYIYGIARCKGVSDNCFVSSDENRTLKIWENNENIQDITLPAQSVWTTKCLSNGDIVTGSSDGLIRIFTRDSSRYADEQALTKFAEEVNHLTKQTMQEIGGVKVSDLPGREALYDPGKRAGQMKMIRENGKVIAYTWVLDGENSHWEQIGEVMGDSNKDETGKTMYEGKAYDFVFSVDVEDGKPPLKLPYNLSDDVYDTAQKFLAKHLLPADYLEQIVDFILKNSKQQYKPPVREGYVDPFTGGSRYTPSYQSNGEQTGINADPFTGDSSYATGRTSAQLNSQGPSTNSQSAYFPISTYKTFDAGDPTVIIKKIKEFNGRLTDPEFTDTDLDKLMQICTGPPDDEDTYEMLFKILNWPNDMVFPVLDVIRLAVKNKSNNEVLANKNENILMQKIHKYIIEGKEFPNNAMLAFRIISNLCIHNAGENVVHSSMYDLLENVTDLTNLNKNTQVALSTVLLNLTILAMKRKSSQAVIFCVLANVLPDILTRLTDCEAQFRCYVAIGTLLVACKTVNEQEILPIIVGNQEFLNTIQLHSFPSSQDIENKRSECAKHLQSLLN